MFVIGLIAFAFIVDNSAFIQDMNKQYEKGCEFTYIGKHEVIEEIPNIPVDGKYIYFTMEPCD